MRFFGFKRSRFTEWAEVLKEEQRSKTFWGKAALGLTLLRAALRLGRVNRKEWRRRMRVCRKCPIFGPGLKRCRRYSASKMGCGCYTPFAALALEHCWAFEHLSDPDVPGW